MFSFAQELLTIEIYREKQRRHVYSFHKAYVLKRLYPKPLRCVICNIARTFSRQTCFWKIISVKRRQYTCISLAWYFRCAVEGANSRVGSVKAENIFFANLTTETKHLYSFLYLKYHLGVSNVNFKKHCGVFKVYKGLGSMFSRFKQPCLRHGRILILKFVKNIIIKMIN